ncbi:hypothetical protein HFN06_06145 [Rhizobium leguminosarum]|uniref:hypothetical protein n=1 Tax=Rhizobium TaxID=379 RepID=UPI0014423CF7|nr:hypothetical protein [Rhizobium leguminosarum]MCA2431025.1 hypothetical protein [Rhizobium leguminosarum]NKK09155.1 hypothetical protein [Rhizobium leguminosarum bv. viciae]
MIKKIISAAVLVLTTSQLANASSDAAWNALFAKANGTCIGQSGMDTPEASAPVVFDDSVGKIGVLLRESIGKGKSKIQDVNLICLYDKKTGKASIEEFRWLGR